VAATEAVVASEIARFRMKEREKKAIFTSERSQTLSTWIFPLLSLWGSPRYLLGRVSPQRNSRDANVRKPFKQWPSNASFSIKNRFRILNWFLMCGNR
jgi:hypothetical protein